MSEITQLLSEWRAGNREAENELFSMVLPDLQRLAHYLMKGERKGHTLQPTELVNQIYLRWSRQRIGIGGTGATFSLLLPEPCAGI
jgi:hypothetical protein